MNKRQLWICGWLEVIDGIVKILTFGHYQTSYSITYVMYSNLVNRKKELARSMGL